MKKNWSSHWVKSIQKRKQRKYRFRAPLHIKHKFITAHLAPELRKRFTKRSLPLRKGDEVRIMIGSFKGLKGVVERINLKETKVYVDTIKVKKSDGSEIMRALHPSNLLITNLNLDDKARVSALEKKKEPQEVGGTKK